MPTPLPSGATLDHLKKLAKRLLKNGRAAQPTALLRFHDYHPKFTQDVEHPETLKLQQAQLVIAREYGFSSWPQLVAAANESARNTLDASGILVITNGLMAVDALNRAQLPGHKEEWLEALHDGPVPQTQTTRELNHIRAQHIARLGWSSEEGAFQRFERRDALIQQHSKYNELQLWFEHDLYDQLQLIHCLTIIAEQPEWNGKVRLIQTEHFLPELSDIALQQATQSSILIDTPHLELAQQAWNAFRSDTTEALQVLLKNDLSALPKLSNALHRLLEEHPAPATGLGRTEQQILQAVHSGASTPTDIFRYNQQQEDAAYIGDLSFFNIIERLCTGHATPLESSDQPHQLHEASSLNMEAFKSRTLRLTASGKAILTGAQRYDSPNYWIGGTQIDS